MQQATEPRAGERAREEHTAGMEAIQPLAQALGIALSAHLLHYESATVPDAADTSRREEATHSVSVLAARSAAVRPAHHILLDEFLAPEELAGLWEYSLQRKPDFQTTKVMRPGTGGGMVDPGYRRSCVLFEMGRYQKLIAERILSYLPWICDRLNHPLFSPSKVEVQLTASNDGEFFKAHNDNTHEVLRTRDVTFVYYFHREPKGFAGGELRLYDSRFENGRYVAENTFNTIVPQQNQVVFFSSDLMHEVLPVRCPSHAFEDGRFTLNGWLHK